ncbi:DUF937 domain-containing protein [Microvirga tunisiensis]|uniref:DUF937 domain-containing protein n=1 Tax=Pannonibacter tanglangensis TaxID=2750084 RepID=A0A7X5J8U2_9HYPH|nr:DUF937 domain-containing protein [Pannonibacter sp. XCT-53]NBN79064.1 DUF937 domain-containing protein [Pannonibacter sp. XCT-53]
MSDASGLFTSLDPAGVVETMRRQFGLGDADISRAMGALLPAAFAGLKHMTAAPDAMQGFLGFLKAQAPQGGAGDAFSFGQGLAGAQGLAGTQGLAGAQGLAGGLGAAPTAWFFGPAPMQQAIADQVAKITGVQQDAVTALMPVAATLATAQVARPYLQGQARDLFDAFMAGYARGRPKPAPTPAGMMAGYTDAVQSFWTRFLGLDDKAPLAPFWQTGTSETAAARRPAPPAREPAPEKAPEKTPERASGLAPDPAAEAAGATVAGPAAILNDWFAASRAFQETQIRAIESVFDSIEGKTA